MVLVHHLIKSGRSIATRIGGGRAVQAVARSILVLASVDDITRILLDLPDGEADYVVLDHFKSSYGREAEPLLFERAIEPHPVSHTQTVAILIESASIPDSLDAEILGSERSRGWRRRIARALIERFLLRGPSASEDLLSDVTVVEEISKETYERARTELVNEGVIEHPQKDGRHWWRLRVPDRLPDL